MGSKKLIRKILILSLVASTFFAIDTNSKVTSGRDIHADIVAPATPDQILMIDAAFLALRATNNKSFVSPDQVSAMLSALENDVDHLGPRQAVKATIRPASPMSTSLEGRDSYYTKNLPACVTTFRPGFVRKTTQEGRVARFEINFHDQNGALPDVRINPAFLELIAAAIYKAKKSGQAVNGFEFVESILAPPAHSFAVDPSAVRVYAPGATIYDNINFVRGRSRDIHEALTEMTENGFSDNAQAQTVGPDDLADDTRPAFSANLQLVLSDGILWLFLTRFDRDLSESDIRTSSIFALEEKLQSIYEGRFQEAVAAGFLEPPTETVTIDLLPDTLRATSLLASGTGSSSSPSSVTVTTTTSTDGTGKLTAKVNKTGTGAGSGSGSGSGATTCTGKIISETGVCYKTDGSRVLPDGTTVTGATKDKEVITLKDGTTLYKDGTILNNDGSYTVKKSKTISITVTTNGNQIIKTISASGTTTTIIKTKDCYTIDEDGTVTAPNGVKYLPNGDVTWPDGTVIHPNGTMVLKDGNTVLANGNWLTKDGEFIANCKNVVADNQTSKKPGSGGSSSGGTAAASGTFPGTSGNITTGGGGNPEAGKEYCLPTSSPPFKVPNPPAVVNKVCTPPPKPQPVTTGSTTGTSGSTGTGSTTGTSGSSGVGAEISIAPTIKVFDANVTSSSSTFSIGSNDGKIYQLEGIPFSDIHIITNTPGLFQFSYNGATYMVIPGGFVFEL